MMVFQLCCETAIRSNIVRAIRFIQQNEQQTLSECQNQKRAEALKEKQKITHFCTQHLTKERNKNKKFDV